MYSEISNQFLYTEEEFKNTKSRDLLKLKCPSCDEVVEFTKHKIQTNWRRSSSKILYCSYDCSKSISNIETEKINCLHCSTEFERNITNKRSKDTKFCTKSCCATYMNINRTKQEKEEINTKVSLKLKGKYTKKKKNLLLRFLTISVKYGYTFNYNITNIVSIKKIKPIKQKINHKVKYKKLTLLPKKGYTSSYNIKHIISTRKVYKSNCISCNKLLISLNKPLKICSKECFKTRMKQVHLEKPHLILNRSNPESYLERSFREYIEQKGYIKNDSFIQEKHWKLSSDKRYISDFYLPNLNLIVELDRKTT